MPLEIVTTRDAAKDLAKLPNADRERVERRIEAYAEAPEAAGHDVIPLAGARGLFRLRSGDWRVIFELDGDEMRILSVKHRREAYR
jgi:mRNA interferase RelE/StbE